jgi:hypothetical protein
MPPDRPYPRRNRYALAVAKPVQPKKPRDCAQKRVRKREKTPSGIAPHLFSVDNTVDNAMLFPQIPVRSVRRSGYGFAQKWVRAHAESGSRLRRIWFGLPL